MIAPFDWWLLIVGLAAGAGLAWLVLAELRRHEEELDEGERANEASWIAATLESQGPRVSAETVADILALHRWYLSEPPRQGLAGSDESVPERDEGAPGTD